MVLEGKALKNKAQSVCLVPWSACPEEAASWVLADKYDDRDRLYE